MRNIVITVCLIGAGSIILGQFGFFDALLILLLAGVVPGTTIIIAPSVMFWLIMCGIALVIASLIGKKILASFYSLSEVITPTVQPTTKKHLPKRRFSQI